MHDVIANIKLSDLLSERPAGELVNSHVVRVQKEPKPDFEAMRKTVHGGGELGKEDKPTPERDD